MRNTMFGDAVATPEDTNETIVEAWGDFTPETARINDVQDEVFGFGGEVFDEDGNSREFDGFDSMEEARLFAINVIGVPAHDVEDVEG